jgi:hypothetical protein
VNSTLAARAAQDPLQGAANSMAGNAHRFAEVQPLEHAEILA